MSDQSAQSFLNLLEKSGIVEEPKLTEEIEGLKKRFGDAGLSVDLLTEFLLEQGLVTQWHLDKLKQGKYKGFFLGKYKLLGLLGTGGMSSVYLAEHRLSGQRRAIKVLPRKKVSDKSYLDRFYQEARAAASLNHPNIVRIYDICNEGDTHYMVMEHVQGKNLHEIVTMQGPVNFNKAVDFCAQVCEGLSHAHKRGLVHRDIKPANLIETDEGVIKILDLGLALVNQDDNESLTLLYNEKVMGTADYLSPEQAVNSHYVDPRSDIYSLGCTLYFLLTGHPPFPKGNLAQRIAMHQTQEPADIREDRAECPEALVAICRQLMMKKPEHRYQNCADLKADLVGWLETGRQLGTGLLPGSAAAAQSAANANFSESGLTSPILIDTTGSGKFSNSAKSKSGGFLLGSSKKSRVESSKKLSEESTIKSQSGKTSGKFEAFVKRKAPPKWVLPVMILIMFLMILLVLYVVNKTLLNVPPPPPKLTNMDSQAVGLGWVGLGWVDG